MHRTEPSRIQGLALQLADKINILVEQNERLWELKQMGAFGQNQQRADRRDNQRGWQDRQFYDKKNQGQDRRRNSRYNNRNDE